MKKSLFWGLIVLFAVSVVSCKPKQSAYKAAYEKATEKEPEEEIVEEAPIKRTPPPTTTRPAYDASTTREKVTAVDGQLKKYSVVIGSFQNKTNAEKLKSDMKARGFNAQLALNEQRKMYRVLVATYDEKSDAAYKRDEIKSDYAPQFKDAWILEREF